MVGGNEFEKIKRGKGGKFKGEKPAFNKKRKVAGESRGKIRSSADVGAMPDSFEASPIEDESPTITEYTDKKQPDNEAIEKEWGDKYDSLVDQRLYSGSNWIQIKAYNISERKFRIFSNLGNLHNEIISQDRMNELLVEYKMPAKKDQQGENAEGKIQIKKNVVRGQIASDISEADSEILFINGKPVYKNGSSPHDADEALKERAEKKDEQEAGKEITAEDLEVFLEVANEHRKRLQAEYEKEGLLEGYSERRRRDLLDVKTAKFLGDRFQENFGVSQEKAEELADKIMEKAEI